MSESASGQQTSFTSGELDPRLQGRIEVARYYAGARLLRDLLVVPQGGIRRRPGMAHVATLAAAALDGVRLIPFAFNAGQTYCIALSAGRADIFRADGTLAAAVTGAPWSAAQAAQVNWAQSGDTLLVVHPDLAPQQLRRGTPDTSWTLGAIAWTNIPAHDFGAGPEAVMSASRGWPEAITFHQGRLWIGGLRSRPASLIGSRVGSFFDLNTGTALDDEAIYATIDSDQVNAIHQLRSGRTLQVFTSGAEFAPDVQPPYTPKNFSLIEQSRRGIQRFTPVQEVDGATLFVQRGGAALRSFLYSDLEQAFNADLLSLLAPHLVRAPRDSAARKGATGDDADHVLFCNPDGEATVLTTLRAQEVTAFARWSTAGQIRAVAALMSGEVFFAVARLGSLRIERWDEARLLDASARAAGSAMTSLGGLSHLEGQQVHLVLDRAYVGTATVAGGAVALPRAAQVAEAGLLFTPRAETLPIEPRLPSGSLIGRKVRLASVTARLRDCGTFNLQGRPVIFRRLGAGPVLDGPPPVFTGDVMVRGLVGWRFQQVLTIEQPVPGPLTVLALAYDARVGA